MVSSILILEALERTLEKVQHALWAHYEKRNCETSSNNETMKALREEFQRVSHFATETISRNWKRKFCRIIENGPVKFPSALKGTSDCEAEMRFVLESSHQIYFYLIFVFFYQNLRRKVFRVQSGKLSKELQRKLISARPYFNLTSANIATG